MFNKHCWENQHTTAPINNDAREGKIIMYDKFRCCLLGRLFYCETEEIYEVKPVFGTKSDIPAAGSSLGRPRRHFTFRRLGAEH